MTDKTLLCETGENVSPVMGEEQEICINGQRYLLAFLPNHENQDAPPCHILQEAISTLNVLPEQNTGMQEINEWLCQL